MSDDSGSTTDSKKKPPITLHSRQLACKNIVYSVYFDHISDTNGVDVKQYISVVPNNSIEDSISGIAILPIKEKHFGLIQIHKHPLGRWGWEIPKGFIDRNETAVRASVRELEEETGFQVSTDCLQSLGIVYPEAGLVDARIQIFLANVSACSHTTIKPTLELGHNYIRFFSQDDIRKMIKTGDIEDSCTLSALLFYFFMSATL